MKGNGSDLDPERDGEPEVGEGGDLGREVDLGWVDAAARAGWRERVGDAHRPVQEREHTTERDRQIDR